jgi:multidrug efflux pump subunit AcrA (membrane-fusion protein)
LVLKALGLGVAGLAAGGAAAWTKGELDAAATAGATVADAKHQLENANAAKAALALSFTALQNQANDLQTQLAAATGQNTQLAGAVNAAQQEAADLKAKLTAAQTALDAANQRLGNTHQLLGLYGQLEGVGLDGVVSNGLGVVSGALSGLAGPAGLLRDGINSAHGLLTGFEQVLPDFSSSMAWLGDQVVKLKVGLWAVETSAQQAANSTLTGLTAAFGGFVGFVLDHLPFNIGASVRSTLASVQSLLGGITTMTDQAADQVLLKISKHVDDGPQGWKQTLVTPLRDNTLAPASQVLAGIAGTSDTYHSSLKDPATTALQQRQALRDEIAAFRNAHGL